MLEQRRGVRSLLARHYAQLARKVAERSAETGEHYIAHSRDEYRDMLRRAAGGGAVLAGTTLLKFGILALGLTAFWGGFWAGANYALSFVRHHAAALDGGHQAAGDDGAGHGAAPGRPDAATTSVEAFVDDVVHLMRSQAAGIFGNLALCAPLVLARAGLSLVAARARRWSASTRPSTCWTR